MFSDNVKGVIMYDEDGCQGEQYSFMLEPGYTSGFFPNVGETANNKANSCMFYFIF